MARILIVDDSVIMRRNINAILSQGGHEIVSEAANGLQAITEYEQAKPDLVTMDITMPIMDGVEAAKKIVEKYPKAKIIMISSLEQKNMVFNALEVGARHYIIKPITSDKLLSVVNEVLIEDEDVHDLNDKWMEIKTSKEQIVELNKSVEERVEERTGQLEKTNIELKNALEELKSTQLKLIQSEKLGGLANMVAGIAHEINTPVGISITAISHLQERTKDLVSVYQSNTMKKSDLEKFLKLNEETSIAILTNLKRASELIKSFKQVAVDQSSEQKRVFYVKNYINQILLSLRPELKKTKIEVKVNCDDNIILDSYPGAISQIITNLIMNSLIHAYDENEIGIIVINISKDTQRFIIEYSDDGKGISQENLKRVFEPFFTTRRNKGGTGLGLNIVYNIVTSNLKGTIECESEEGKGTAFIINMPV